MSMDKIYGLLGEIGALKPPEGMIAKGNLSQFDRPIVGLLDGSWGTSRSMVVETPDGKAQAVVPMIMKDGRLLNEREAADHYYRTGETYGTFDTIDNAVNYSKLVHEMQQLLYGKKAKEMGYK